MPVMTVQMKHCKHIPSCLEFISSKGADETKSFPAPFLIESHVNSMTIRRNEL